MFGLVMASVSFFGSLDCLNVCLDNATCVVAVAIVSSVVICALLLSRYHVFYLCLFVVSLLFVIYNPLLWW